jgi:zinc/manganese transport system substrate-binding protein
MDRRSFFLVATAALLSSGVLLPAPAAADLKIVATTADLASVARELVGGHGEVTALALHTQDPHFVDARPHLALALARADLLLAVGLELEVGWLPTLQTGSRNDEIQVGGRGYLDCSRFVELLEVPAARVDRSMGDVHGGGNPHYLMEPDSAVRVARGIAARLAELDPDHASAYRQKLTEFVARTQAAERRWRERLSSLRGTKVVAYHRSFPYLARWLGFRIVEHLEPRPGIPPNPRHVAQVIATARSQNVRLLLQETYYPANTAELVADQSPSRLAIIPGGPDVRAGESYVDFIDQVGQRLLGALR